MFIKHFIKEYISFALRKKFIYIKYTLIINWNATYSSLRFNRILQMLKNTENKKYTMMKSGFLLYLEQTNCLKYK